MRRRTWAMGVAGVFLVVGAGVWGPGIFRAQILRWERRAVWRTVEKLAPQTQRGLAMTPKPLKVRRGVGREVVMDRVELGGYVVLFPRAVSMEVKANFVLLHYGGYRVLILTPSVLAEADAMARRLGYRDWFEESVAIWGSA